MEIIQLTIGFLILCSFMMISNAFDFTITMPDGSIRSLSTYQGKPIMIVVLPSVQNDTNSSMLYSLNGLQQQFKDSITIIGIPSYEDGYADDSLENVLLWYHSILDSSFVVAQGMNSRKSSPYQSDLFHWLTHAEENGHFDQDVMGAWEKFLITRDGSLYGLISPDAPFDSNIFGEILNSAE